MRVPRPSARRARPWQAWLLRSKPRLKAPKKRPRAPCPGACDGLSSEAVSAGVSVSATSTLKAMAETMVMLNWR